MCVCVRACVRACVCVCVCERERERERDRETERQTDRDRERQRQTERDRQRLNPRSVGRKVHTGQSEVTMTDAHFLTARANGAPGYSVIPDQTRCDTSRRVRRGRGERREGDKRASRWPR